MKDLNSIVKPQEKALFEKAVLFSGDGSVEKRPYPSDKKFTIGDFFRILLNITRIIMMIRTLKRSVLLIKNDKPTLKHHMSEEDFSEFTVLLKKLGVVSIGVMDLQENHIFKGAGVPYKKAIVVSIPMDKGAFKSAPHMDAQLEVLKIYGSTGYAANCISEFLRSKGCNASPNHSMGGSVDYSRIGMISGIGNIGRHGMLITPECGPCHRLSVIYTDIDDISELKVSQCDHAWIAEFCQNCGKCMRACPTSAIFPEAHKDTYSNVTCIDYEKCCAGFKNYGCGICINVCPFTQVGYSKLYKAHLQKKTRQGARDGKT